MTRRRLAPLCATLFALSGCTNGGSADDGSAGAGGALGGSGGGASGGDTSGGGAGDSPGGGGEMPGGGGGVDARPYANVTAVAVTGASDAYTFAVTVESADIDCTQYADFWEVLSEDGALVYRRILEHSHTDDNETTDPDAPGNTFTRSGGPVEISVDDVVVVRAHMNNEGYNGAVLRGSAAQGFAEAPDIGSDFAPGVEDDTPLPADCLF